MIAAAAQRTKIDKIQQMAKGDHKVAEFANIQHQNHHQTQSHHPMTWKSENRDDGYYPVSLVRGNRRAQTVQPNTAVRLGLTKKTQNFEFRI